MGMIAALTPGQKNHHSIPCQHKMTELNLIEKSKVVIIDPRFAVQICRELPESFTELPSLTECDKSVELLCELFNFKQATPGWEGMMHIIREINTQASLQS